MKLSSPALAWTLIAIIVLVVVLQQPDDVEGGGVMARGRSQMKVRRNRHSHRTNKIPWYCRGKNRRSTQAGACRRSGRDRSRYDVE